MPRWWLLQLKPELKDWTENKLWFCPKATKPGGVGARVRNFNTAWSWKPLDPPGFTVGKNGLSGSYGLNGYLISVSDPGKDYPRGAQRSKDRRTFSRIRQPATVPAMVDALEYQVFPLPDDEAAADADGEEAWDSNLPGMKKACIDRHRGFVSALFADSSVRKVGLKELWTLKWYQNFKTDGPMTLAGGVSHDDWPDWIRRYKDY